MKDKETEQKKPSQFSEGQKPASTLVTAVPMTAIPTPPKKKDS